MVGDGERLAASPEWATMRLKSGRAFARRNNGGNRESGRAFAGVIMAGTDFPVRLQRVTEDLAIHLNQRRR